MQLSKLAHKYTCYIVLAFELYIFLIRLNIFRVIYVTCGVHKIIDGSVQCGRVEIVKQEKILFTGCLRKYLWRFWYRLVVVLWVQMCMYIGHDCLLSSLARNHALQYTAKNNTGVLPKFPWVFT